MRAANPLFISDKIRDEPSFCDIKYRLLKPDIESLDCISILIYCEEDRIRLNIFIMYPVETKSLISY